APEPLAGRVVARDGRHRLEGDGTIELLVARRVDDAHAALAELTDDPIVADAPRQAVAHGRFVAERGWNRRRRGRRRRRLAPEPIGPRGQRPAGPLVVRFLRHAVLDVTPGLPVEQDDALPTADREVDGRVAVLVDSGIEGDEAETARARDPEAEAVAQ